MPSIRSIRLIGLALLSIWILGILVGLADLFQLPFGDGDEFDSFGSNDLRSQQIRNAIEQGRFHMVIREKFNKGSNSNEDPEFMPLHERKRRSRKRKRKKRQRLPPQNFTLPKPVIVVGFPKAGTSSLFHFFRKQAGYLKCQHWVGCHFLVFTKECLVVIWSTLVTHLITFRVLLLFASVYGIYL